MLEQDVPASAEPTVKNAASFRRRRSAAAKLLQAAALAAALVPLAAVTADATSISCGYNSGGGFSGCGSGFHGGAVFGFGEYAAELSFDNVLQFFSVEITDVHMTLAEVNERLDPVFAGYQPVPICQDVFTCVNEDGDFAPYVEFRVTDPPPVPNQDFESSGSRGFTAAKGYDLYLYWLADTDPEFPNPQILHDDSGTDPDFDRMITLPGTYFNEPPDGMNPCLILSCFSEFKIEGDPGVGGRDNMFTGFTLADASASEVPEPASMLLLGTGLSTLAYRRRRRAEKAPRD